MILERPKVRAAVAAVLAVLLLGCGLGSNDSEAPEADPTADPAWETSTDDVPAETGERNPGPADHTISGRTLDRQGRPLADVDIQIYLIPRSFGSLYRTHSDSHGRFSYRVPEGVYNVIAEYDDPSDGDPIGLNLVVIDTGDLSAPVTVPPSQVIDFQLT